MKVEPTSPPPQLRRVLGFWSLLFYGLSVIVGAGIYVAIGAVIQRAGNAAPISFLLAGIAAGMTGFCYAELASRFPQASGAVSYVGHAFGSQSLSRITGAALTIAVAVAAASIARGSTHYLAVLLPLSPTVLISLLVGGFTVIAGFGVETSVGLAATLGVIEIAGLLAAAAAGFTAAPEYSVTGIVPRDFLAWRGTVSGAFVAFFAFIGFESLTNLAEEVVDPARNLRRGILGAIAVSIGLYIVVATAAVLADTAPDNVLLGLFEGFGAKAFALVAAIAVANGVLVEIMMLARLIYGMGRGGQLPSVLGQVHPRTQTPILATFLAGGIVLITALLLPFERLLVLTNMVTLSVFALVDLAFWRMQHRKDVARKSRLVPFLGIVLSLLLIAFEVFS